MDHNLEVVSVLTVGFALASLFSYITQRLNLPSILGYLLAGYIIGPYSPGFVADTAIADQLAEIGVILMLFGVGLHFKLEDLNSVKAIALPSAIIQMAIATLFSIYIVTLGGWSWQIGLIIGLSISVASTVVVVRVLTDNGIVNTLQGRIAIGWLVVEDVFTVIILILLPTIASVLQGESYSFMTILEAVAIVLGKFAVLTLFMFTWGHQVVSYLLTNIARLRSHELFTLATLAIVFMIAVGSSLIFGTSIALGAFIAGMVIAKTSVKHQAAANSLPLKDIFAIIFFISIGMIFNPHAILENFSLFVGVLAVILVIKPIVAFLVANALKCSLKVALTVAILLAQIGEFSFILAEQTMS
ncbi:MAG: cation:proton antiporter domain-containing protein, partial [Parachlamydiaceae bacterium]